MNAKDLMIGDWVKSRGKIEQVTSVYDGFICTDSFEDSHDYYFDPIPLTPEILEKNGFSNNYIEDDLSYATDFGGAVIGVHIVAGKGVMDEMYFNYVHELQHALRICEIEKEIEL